MSTSWEIGQRAYIKAILHALKYKANAVNGVLLGSADGGSVKVVDAVPLFHTQLALAPMLEVALGQARLLSTRAVPLRALIMPFLRCQQSCSIAF